MPLNTRVGRCVTKLRHVYGYGKAIGICQHSTKQNYLTGKTDDPSMPAKKEHKINQDPTFADLGMPYGGKIPEDLKDTYVDLAKSYFKRHPELLNKE